MELKASILIPTYNEKDNICLLTEKIIQILSEAKIDYQIIIIDDNSPDQTGRIAKNRFKNTDKVLVIIKENEKGLAKALHTGIRHAIHDILVFMDADFSHDPQELPHLINYAKDYNIVNTSRFLKGGGLDYSMYWQILSPLGNKFLNFILKFPTTDNTDGFFAIQKDALNKLPLDKIFFGYGDYQFRLFFFAIKTKASFYEIPTHYLRRKSGESKTKAWSVGYNYIVEALKLWLTG